MSVTELSPEPGMREAQWETRCELAALYRILHSLRMTDLIYTHMSARIPGEEGTFLINRYGELFDEVTASSLIKMDMGGNVIGDPARYNNAGFCIHSGVYLARPDVNCVMHTHSRSAVAVASTRRGLLPISQDALTVYDELGYHDYGVPGTMEEREALGRSCAQANCLILRNHGLLTVGPTIRAAFLRMYYLEHACQEQAAAAAMGDELVEIAADVRAEVARKGRKNRAHPSYGDLEWEALLRMLDRRGVDYRR